MIRQALAFAGKTRRRGWSYVEAVSAYHAHRVRYQLAPGETGTPGGASAPGGVFHFHAAEVRTIVQAVPVEIQQRVLREADEVVAQRFSFRGLPEVQFADGVDWTACPEDNLSWSWDLNRHRYFPTLGTAFFYSGDRNYLQKLLQLWQNWVELNPAGRGANWKSPFEVAARLSNWLWAYFLLDASDTVSVSEKKNLYRALLDHATFLAAHLEYHWPNNHLLLEAKALYEFALAFPDGAQGQMWKEKAGTLLEEQVAAQVLGDGVHAELCSMYHEIIAGELGELLLLNWRLGVPVTPVVEERIVRMGRFSRALCRADGTRPQLGESSANDTNHRFDFAQHGHSDLNFWVWPVPANATEQHARVYHLEEFPDAGYAIVRGGEPGREVHLVFDAGPFSRCAAANHGHCDALSFEFHAAGEPVLVDPGFYYPWNDDREWANFFRSTAAHNTLRIDGKEQSDLSGHWDVGKTAESQLGACGADGQSARVSGQSVPFWAEGLGIRHRRELEVQAGHLSVHDQISGSGRHHVEWFFHLAPELAVEQTGDCEFRGISRKADVTARVVTPRAGFQLRLVRGEQKPLQGWVALTSARVTPATVAIYSAEVELPFEARFTFEIQAREGGES
jgi:hypothetical protein